MTDRELQTSPPEMPVQPRSSLMPPGYSNPDQIGVTGESAAQLISRIRTYQELRLEDVASEENLRSLPLLELDELTTRLECGLYFMLARAATNRQLYWRYEAHVDGRRQYMGQLARLAEAFGRRPVGPLLATSPDSRSDKIVLREETISQLVSRVRIYQEILLEERTPKDQLEELGHRELDQLTIRLECRLYGMLLRGTDDEQRVWRYEERVNTRRDYLSRLSTMAEAPEKQGPAHQMKAQWVRYLEGLLRRRVTPVEELLTLSFRTLENLADDLQAEIQARLAVCPTP